MPAIEKAFGPKLDRQFPQYEPVHRQSNMEK